MLVSSRTFSRKIAKFVTQIFPATCVLLFDFLSYAAEYLASWQHCKHMMTVSIKWKTLNQSITFIPKNKMTKLMLKVLQVFNTNVWGSNCNLWLKKLF
jgi:hypothetical protein